MFMVKVLKPSAGGVRCSVGGPALCCGRRPAALTLGVRTVSNVRVLSDRWTAFCPNPRSGSRALLKPGTVLRFGPAPRARPLSGNGAGSGTSGWYNSLAESAPVHLCEQYLAAVQQVTGIPWWLSIVTSTVMVRTMITLPLAAYQVVIIAKVSEGHQSLKLLFTAD